MAKDDAILIDPSDRSGWSAMPAAAKFITTVGVPSAIALFLVWRLTAGIEAQQHAITTALTSHVHASAETAKDVQSMREAVAMQIAVMRQICVNTARTPEQLRECVR